MNSQLTRVSYIVRTTPNPSLKCVLPIRHQQLGTVQELGKTRLGGESDHTSPGRLKEQFLHFSSFICAELCVFFILFYFTKVKYHMKRDRFTSGLDQFVQAHGHGAQLQQSGEDQCFHHTNRRETEEMDKQGEAERAEPQAKR